MTAQTRDPYVPADDLDTLVQRLRSAGCVFAEDEAVLLHEAAVDQAQLESFVRRRTAGEPLEPILGWVAFGRLRLAVGPGVFVPRQRSRVLASIATKSAMAQSSPILLEAFCGVAPIGATVADAVLRVEAHLTDIDAGSLVHARANVKDAAGVYCGNHFDGVPGNLRGQVTLIVAVPPYVPLAEGEFLPREARDHEPSRALFGGLDGLDHVRALVSTADTWLAPRGSVLIEMHVSQCAPSAGFARQWGFLARRRMADNQTAVLELRRESEVGPYDRQAWPTLPA